MVKSKSSSSDLENSELPPLSDPETNVYNFGILLLEVISGKSPYTERDSLLSWVKSQSNSIIFKNPYIETSETVLLCFCLGGAMHQRQTEFEELS